MLGRLAQRQPWQTRFFKEYRVTQHFESNLNGVYQGRRFRYKWVENKENKILTERAKFLMTKVKKKKSKYKKKKE